MGGKDTFTFTKIDLSVRLFERKDRDYVSAIRLTQWINSVLGCDKIYTFYLYISIQYEILFGKIFTMPTCLLYKTFVLTHS